MHVVVSAVTPDGTALSAGNFSRVRNANQLHWKILAHPEFRGEFFQFRRRQRPAHIHHRRETHIRFVVAISTDSFVVTHARKRRFDLVSRSFERSRQKSFDDSPDRIRLRIGHLQIDLRKLGLTVGAKIFIAEATHNLKIFVEA